MTKRPDAHHVRGPSSRDPDCATSPKPEASQHYAADAENWASEFESVDPAKTHEWLLDFLPTDKNVPVIDVGAGSGRDAAWFASMGYPTLAVEPTADLMAVGQRLHSEPSLTWLDDNLPELRKVVATQKKFGFAHLCGVWMHVPPDQRSRSFATLVGLLSPQGVISFMVRVPHDSKRAMHPTPVDEIPGLAAQHGCECLWHDQAPDFRGRPDVSWLRYAVRLGQN